MKRTKQKYYPTLSDECYGQQYRRLEPKKIKEIAKFYADPLHDWQEEFWGADHQKLTKTEYRRAIEVAINEAMYVAEHGEGNSFRLARA